LSDPTTPTQYTAVPPPPSAAGGAKIPILFGAVIALLAANVYLFVQLDRVKTEAAKNHETLLNEISALRESSTVTTQTARKNIDTLKDELESARRQASMAAGQAKADATKRAEELAKRLEAEQAKTNQQVKAEIGEVKQSASTANTRIAEVNTEVTGVKTDLSSTKGELEKTINSLKRVAGDVDGHATLIATNSTELAALKALGDRNFFEFDIKKAKQATKVGDITITLKKTDPKKNKYTIDVVADDKKVEKKDKNTNEPVQFYVLSKAKQPWEIVVNTVGKDEIKGYLATPKVQNPR
jgi:chromosome segregation ATPase